jgi:hypothetical protein
MRRKDTKLVLPVGTLVTMVKTLDDELLILYDNKYYKLECVANHKTTAHTPPMSHPWKARSYQKMLERKRGKE